MQVEKKYTNFIVRTDDKSNTPSFVIKDRTNAFEAVREVINYLGFNGLNGEYDLTYKGGSTQVSRKSRISEVINNCVASKSEKTL